MSALETGWRETHRLLAAAADASMCFMQCGLLFTHGLGYRAGCGTKQK